ncbi:MAG: prolyl oligopeptidase family serine peptidase, partial [Planctomycetota bacterium]|nr:prolyl oligopeptidase family serine peptidase [Planctomycetota bacterium]
MVKTKEVLQVWISERRRPCALVSVCAVLLVSTGASTAQTKTALTSGYRMPPKAIVDLVDAPPTPSVRVDPNKRWMVLLERPNLPPLAELSQPELRVAGLRLNPRTNGPSRRSHNTNIIFKSIADLSERPITGLPENPRIGNVIWAPDGRRIAFTLTREAGIELWAAELETAAAKKLTPPRLNAASGSAFRWMPDSRALICRLTSADRGTPPQAPNVPAAPIVEENIGKKRPARTYQDLLKNQHDAAAYEYYMTCRAVHVTLEGKTTALGAEGLVNRAGPSPDGKYVLIETIHRPYSYLVPSYRFPRRIEVWDIKGKLVHRVVDLPLADDVPIGFAAVPRGPRSVGWRSDAPATLYWVEALDDGDPRKEAEFRDRVFMLPAPFKGGPTALISLAFRYGGISWGNGRLALASESWWETRKRRTWIVKPDAPDSEPSLLFDLSSEDRYNDPGRPLTRRTPAGTSVLLTADNGKALYLSGRGASPEGDRPFLDRLDLATCKTERLWRSEAPFYESVVSIIDAEKGLVLTSREAKTTPPNYHVRNLRSGDLRQITNFPDPTPQLAGVHKELIRYKRDDGVQLSATLYLPAGYSKDDGPLPMLMWAYPREFKSADAAGQVSGSPHRFVRVSSGSPLLWLVHGYAVLSGPTMPIIGEGDVEPNDTFVKQLVAGAKAAVDEVVRRGVGDVDRMAIGGHSYGAFMTANLLAHSELFRSGIARSGAYNRTLTPFGFQAEQRTFWEAPEIYFAMSPFMHAHKVNEPILLIHGKADNNSGTFPMQSERYYRALKGHGATARLVMLPHESHGYRARESVMHMLWEMTTWL